MTKSPSTEDELISQIDAALEPGGWLFLAMQDLGRLDPLLCSRIGRAVAWLPLLTSTIRAQDIAIDESETEAGNLYWGV